MMANLTESNSTNFTAKFSNSTVESETQNAPLNIHFIVPIIINGITCPFTVFLNVLVHDNGCEKKTKSSEQRQHLAGLFSGN